MSNIFTVLHTTNKHLRKENLVAHRTAEHLVC